MIEERESLKLIFLRLTLFLVWIGSKLIARGPIMPLSWCGEVTFVRGQWLAAQEYWEKFTSYWGESSIRRWLSGLQYPDQKKRASRKELLLWNPIGAFTHPKTNRKSLYPQIYRHKNLTHIIHLAWQWF